MPRLIDADALMTELSTMYKEPTSTEDFMTVGYDKAIADVVVTAHRQPTVDAVEVVRCRDCLVHGICRYELGLGADGFCSQGRREERRE